MFGNEAGGRGRRSGPALWAGIALSLVFWVLGQNFGGMLAGHATDPNAGPLYVLLALTLCPRSTLTAGSAAPTTTDHTTEEPSRMKALAAQAARSATRSGQSLTYHTKQVTLVALGAPGNRPGMYWQIDGVDGPHGPTVSVPAGASVTVDCADGDPGHPHGFELSTAAPPYSRMAMMQGRIAASGAFIMPVPPPKGNLWYAATVSFKAPSPGTYHIICPVPGHAQQGMWATFVVR